MPARITRICIAELANEELSAVTLRQTWQCNSSSYHMSFACLQCRKSFKRHQVFGRIQNHLPCPDCGGIAHNLGRHFKPPKQSDVKQWRKIAFLIAHGFYFQKIRSSCNVHETVEYPDTLEQAKEFVLRYKDHAINSDPKLQE